MNKIKSLRLENGVSQNELARVLGVTQQAISAYENGMREPDIETLNKIADYFNVSVDYILGRTDIRNPAEKITKALEDDPELLEFWEDISSREDLKIMFKQARDLTPQDIKTIITLIKRFKNEQSTTQL